MLLAGGKGSRLSALTDKNAKPAVAFGGKYKIIDFTLSNCVNSGIDTVGVLTQYQPLALNEYIGNGQPWDLDKNCGGAFILPPYQGKKKNGWYKGTANAIYQNFDFLDKYSPEYVLVLSGDHIYRMDYSKMLDFHKKQGAECSVAVIDVPYESASRFGILKCDDSGRIRDFEEKPKKPKSTLASMGIYIFNYSILKEYLISDEADARSSNDFGKDVIPKMLSDMVKLYAYRHNGYWKDVGTPESYWEANMDLLGETPVFDLYSSDNLRVFSRNASLPPQFIGEEASVCNSIITVGCEVLGRVENSVIFENVKIAEGAYVKDSVIMSNTVIMPCTSVYYSIVDSDCTIGKNAQIGSPRESGGKICVIGSSAVVDDGKIVCGGEHIFADVSESRSGGKRNE